MTTAANRRLALGDRLRQHRVAAGLSGSELARRLGWQNSKVSRIENARQNVSDLDITAWCDVCGFAEDEATALHDELRAIRLEEARMSSKLQVGHAAFQNEFVEREASAKLIRNFEHVVIPGLVQTAEYARQVFLRQSEFRNTTRDADEAVAARMRRQQVLYDPSRRIELLITEAALRYPLCTVETMAGQIDRLRGLQGMPNVWFGIIPLDTQLPMLPYHGFHIIDDLVAADLLNTELVTRDAEDLALFNRAFDALKDIAVEGAGARALLTPHRRRDQDPTGH